jgi:predicted transcriptional regulator
MPDPSQLSKRERQIMDVIYAHGKATISRVLAEIPDPPMRGALRTLLRIMEDKGHLTRRQDGREFVYRPTQPRGRAARSALGRVLDVFYNGSLEKAIAAHLSDPSRARKPSADELQRLSELIEQAKRKGV